MTCQRGSPTHEPRRSAFLSQIFQDFNKTELIPNPIKSHTCPSDAGAYSVIAVPVASRTHHPQNSFNVNIASYISRNVDES